MSSCCGKRAGGSCCSKDSESENLLSPETKAKADVTVRALLSKTLAILNVVENLGPQLTDSSINERLDAVNYLTEVITPLPKDFFLEQEVSSLLAFFTSRLQDSILLLTPTLKSLNFLCNCVHFPNGAERTILAAIFTEVHVQSVAQDDRYRVYKIIDFFLTNRLPGVQSMAVDFILGFIQAIEGERDPRCLLLVFDLSDRICRQVPLDPLSDDVFEVLACYFPITFEPPPNDPYGITAEDLSKGLRRCLIAHAKFAPLCAQVIEENLREDSAKTKREALLLLDDAFYSFPPAAFGEWANLFWDEIRKQVMTPKATDLEGLALKCLESLVGAVAKNTDEDGRNSNLVVLVGQIFRDCEPFLSNPEMQLLDPTNRILLSASKADKQVAAQLSGRALPMFMEKYQSARMAKKEYALLLHQWCQFLVKEQIVTPIFSIRDSFNALIDQMLSVTTSEISDVALQIATSLLLFCDEFGENFFSDEQCLKIATFAMERTGFSTASPEATFLRELSMRRWRLVHQQLLPQIESSVSETTTFLLVLATLIFDATSATSILPHILVHLVVLEDGENQGLLDAVSALQLVLEFNSPKLEDSSRRSLKQGIFSEDDWCRLCDGVRIAAEELSALVEVKETGDGIDGSRHAVMLESVSNLAQELVLYAPERQETFIVDQLLDGVNTSDLWSVTPPPMLIFIGRVIAAMSVKEVECRKLPIDLLPLLNHSDAPVQISKIYASLINKMPATEELKCILDEAIPALERSPTVQSVECYAWLCKALVLRNLGPYGDGMLSQIFHWLNSDNSEIAQGSVNALRIISDDQPNAPLLSSRVGVKTTLLAKQRTFSCAVSLLTKGFELCQYAERKRHFFQALGIVLSSAPKGSHCEAEIGKLLPLLLNSIHSDDANVVLFSVNSLHQLITCATGSLEKLHGHIPSLCLRLADLAKSKGSCMELRSSALDCLTSLASAQRIPPVVLNPWRDKVLKQLTQCLDDHKRLVRRKAVAARNAW